MRCCSVITFSVNTETGEISITSIFDKELNPTKSELKLIVIILSFLPSDIARCVTLERRSKNYISMFYGANDFLRLKYSPRSKWISLCLPRELSSENVDNPLFAAQHNKKQLHWQANLTSLEDLELLKNFIIASCIYIPK